MTPPLPQPLPAAPPAPGTRPLPVGLIELLARLAARRLVRGEAA